MRCDNRAVFVVLVVVVALGPFVYMHRPHRRRGAGHASPFAYVLPVSNASAVDGCVAALASLREHSPCVQTRKCAVVCIADLDRLNAAASEHLGSACDISPLATVLPRAHHHLLSGDRQRADIAMLAAWALVQYQRVVVLSERTLVLRSPDLLLRLPNATHTLVRGSWVLKPTFRAFNALLRSYSAPPPTAPPSPASQSLATPSPQLHSVLTGHPAFQPHHGNASSALFDVPVGVATGLDHLPREAATLRYAADPPPWVPVLRSGVVEYGEAYWLWWRAYERHHTHNAHNANATATPLPPWAPVYRQGGVYTHTEPPSLRTHVWVARGTPGEYLQLLHSLERQARHLWLPSLLPLVSR